MWIRVCSQRVPGECPGPFVTPLHSGAGSGANGRLSDVAEDGQRPEWTFYPRFSSNIHTYHVGKQCFFKGVFLGNRRSLGERTVDKCLGRKKYGNVVPLDLTCAMPDNTLES